MEEIKKKMASGGSSMKPHAVCFPFPAQSHIGTMLKLAKLLHHRDLYITFVNTEFNHRRLLQARGPSFLDNLPISFQFVVIPDGLPSSQANATQDLVALCESARHHMAAPFCALVEGLAKQADSGSGFPPVSFIVADGTMTFSAHPAGEKFGIPVVNLYTVSASFIMVSMRNPKIKEREFTPLKEDESGLANGYLGTSDQIPGMKNMTLCDLPSSDGFSNNDFIINFSMDVIARFDKGFRSIIHTFEKLEPEVMNSFSSMFPTHAYAIGPFQLLLDQIPENEHHLKSIGCNMWKEDAECLRWLDSQKPGSVLYVNFGSIAFLTPEQLIELAMGMANSKHPFLWIIRPDLVKGDAAILPPEFNEETMGKAFVTSWCPQEEVLNHPSVGGFLTHCGWNSTLESLSAGVPMSCWPCAGDQLTNSKYICMEWEVGLEINGDMKRDGVERLVRELMEGNGKHLKKRAMELKKLAVGATLPHGSSSMNLNKLLEDLLSR